MPGTYQYDVEIKSNVAKLLSDMKQVQDRLDTVEGKEYKIKLNVDEKKLSSVISNLEKMLDSLGKGTGDFKQFENLSKELSSIVSEVQSLSKAFGKVDDSGAKTLLSSIQNIDKSLSELSQNILNVNKNMSNMGGNTSGAVKQVENITNESKKAASALEDVAKAQEKVNGQKTNISSGSNPAIEQQNKLQEELKETQTEIVETRSKYQSLLDVAKKQLDNDKGTNYYSGKTTETKAFDNFTFNEQAKRSSHFDVWSKDYEELCSLMDKTEEELKSGSIGFDDAIDRMVSAYQKYDTATKIDVGGFDFLEEQNKFQSELQETASDYEKVTEAHKQMIQSAVNSIPQEENTARYVHWGNSEQSTAILSNPNGMNTGDYGLISSFADCIGEAETSMNAIVKDWDYLHAENFDKGSALIMDIPLDQVKEFEHGLKDNIPQEFIKGWVDTENGVITLNNTLQSELKETQDQAEKTAQSVKNAVSQTTKKDAFPDKDISASVESVTNSIKEENNVLEQNTQKVKENTQAKEQNANANLNKYNKRLDSYNGKVDKYQATINRFNDGGWTSDTYVKNVKAVRDAVKQYATLLDNIKTNQNGIATDEDIQNLDKYEKKIKDTINTVTNMSASEKGYSQLAGQKEIDKINKILRENSAMSSEAKAKIKAYKQELISGNPSVSLEKIHGEIMKIVNAEELAGRAGRSLKDIFQTSRLHQMVAQVAGMFSFYDLINLGRQFASTVTDINTQITELAKVSEQSSKQIYADFDSYADIAKEVRGTISDTIAATADWSKNGYSIPDAKQLAEISQLYKNVGDGIDIDTANESLISTLKGFQLEADQAEHIVDVFNEVSNNEAISSGGIGEALQRSAASFNAASTSLEKSVSLVTATNSVLQNPEKVGNMWRTVSARLRGSETELKEMGEDTDGLVTSTSKLQALVKGITGFDIMKDKDTYKDIYDIVLGIGEKWQDLSDIDRASLLEALAGKQQSNALAAALSNIDILKKSYEEATNAEGSAREENEEYSKSIQASIDLAQAKLEQLANDTLNSNFLKGAIDAGGKLIDILDSIVKSGNAIPAVATAIAAAFSFKNVGIDTLVAY